MYTTTSKQQEGCAFKDSHPKCFSYNDKFHREAFVRGGVRGDVHVLRASYTKVNSNTVNSLVIAAERASLKRASVAAV